MFEVDNGANVLGIDIGTNTLAAITVYDPLHRKVLTHVLDYMLQFAVGI
ncbi:unnamed protein product [marine sediment metagenome]|uniref:Uncharacterized protein n=1 Tax=marine sediment metagenome TaxID=412755 RepID=X1GL47_9ZZZZ